MNTLLPTTLLAAVLLARQALAEDCLVTLNRSEIDYGQLNRTTLNTSGGELQLPPRMLELSVQCRQVQPLILSFRAPGDGVHGYRFGEQGHYRLGLSDARVDGAPADLGAALSMATAGPEIELRPAHAVQAMRNGQPLQGQRLTLKVEVRSRGPSTLLQAPQSMQWRAAGSFFSGSGERPLSLRADFAPAACTPRLGQGGAVDFGRISTRQLAEARVTLLQRSLSVQVQCDGPTRFALIAQDNRAGSARVDDDPRGASLFGIGSGPNGQRLGGYRLRLRDARADVPLAPLYGLGVDWTPAPSAEAVLHHNGQRLGFVREGEGTSGPSALVDFAAQVQVDLYLAPLRELRLQQEIPINGSATLEIVYL